MAAIEQSAGHVKPAGLALGINPESLIRAEHMPIPDKQFRMLPDGSSLLALTTPESRSALATLPPGSIIDLFDQPSLAYARPAVVIDHQPTGTRFWTAHKKDGGEWTRYQIGDTQYSEAEDARLALAELFSLEQGAEATTMLGVALGVGQEQQTASLQDPLSEYGHGAHESPKASLPHNFVLGPAAIRETVMTYKPGGDTRFARVIKTETGIEALRTVGTTGEESNHLLNTAFVSAAEQYARQGTDGFGGQQLTEATLDVLIAATLNLPDQIGNGATAQQVRSEVQRQLRGIKKSR